MADGILVSFTDATRDVLKLMLDLDAKSEKYSITDGTTEKLRVAVEITGDIKGKIYYWFPKDTVLEIVKIMSGMEISEVDDFASSAICEMANIISGNAMNNLYERNFTCDILPPEVSMDNKPVQGESAGALVVTDIGVFNLDIVKNIVKL